jgi:CRISPR-associated endonuclease/helicase Cas3
MAEYPPLRPFQRRVFDLIRKGKSVILQAPTGSGKTRAALAPFIYNLASQESKLPFTCRYAVPLRVLANQFFREYESLAEDIDRESPTRLMDKYRQIERYAISIQTGEQSDDPQMEAALTFCTIDQLLASFLAVPYGMGTNRANLNVGGIIGSYLVLDEFHLYPLLQEGKSVFGARTTAIEMLRLLKSITPFVLMTATFSMSLLSELKELLDAEVVTVTDQDELRDLAQGRSRVFTRSVDPMNAEKILEEHRQRASNRCTLIVCNTVLRAQQLYLQMRRAETEGIRVILLHSRFGTEDRKRLSKEVEEELGPGKWRNGEYLGRDIIVIATQVIEVGLDISVQVLHTENAPANSLIQRAGRCARFAQQQGQVNVYPLPTDDEGKESNTLPYDKGLCAATWNALERFDGKPMGFLEEQELINCVHSEEDKALLKRLSMYEGEILKHIFKSFNTNERSVSSTLIRDVAQVQILIHDDPDSAIHEAPWRWQSFSMHPGSLVSKKRWDALQQRAGSFGPGWVCKEAEPIVEEEQNLPDGADGIDNRQKTQYRWKVVTNPEAIRQALIIAMPSQLARYDDRLGFVLLDERLEIEANGYESQKLPSLPGDKDYKGSHQTSYQEHIHGLLTAYRAGLREDIGYVASRLEHELKLPGGIVDQAVLLAIACHDLGKLDETWQQWALSWQRLAWERKRYGRIYEPPSSLFCFAKTDYDSSSREERAWQSEVKPRRPKHACESVAIARNMIGTSLGITRTAGEERHPVLRAVCGAIARHHTSQASEFQTAHLSKKALEAATEALADACADKTWSFELSLLAPHIDQGGDLAPANAGKPKLTIPSNECGRAGELETWLYFVIVRALRLADQRAG